LDARVITFYRGHWILTRDTGKRWSSEVRETRSAKRVPIDVSIDHREGADRCISLAKQLIDFLLAE
jgi:hypothetical protein